MELPATYIDGLKMDQETFDPIIIEDLQEENRLATAYQSLIASANITFNGSTYNLSSLSVCMSDIDSNLRKNATLAYWNWFAENEKQLASIFDQMVQVRTKMAQKLGFENYVEFGYKRLHRFDYDQKDVSNYRKSIQDTIVPLCHTLYENQKARLGVQTLHAWDEKVKDLQGNPKPMQSVEIQQQNALHMYQELSQETGEFFSFLLDHELLDLETRANKAAGGYCTFIPNYESPFIFSNGNGTSDDIETLTHEAGHALQAYKSRHIFPTACIWPTYESCEIHSMSMEFLTMPWMHLFFGKDAK